MDSDKKRVGVIGSVLAVIIAVIGVSIVWASYTSQLTVKGFATAEGGAKWSVVFEDLENAVVGNSAQYAPTARELAAPSIKGDVSIETFNVAVKTPGDFVSYTFSIKNDGTFVAKIDDGFNMPTPVCIAAEETDANKVCANLMYTLEYADGGTVSAGDIWDAGESKKVTLKLAYKDANDTKQLPSANVSIDGLGITIPFVQG